MHTRFNNKNVGVCLLSFQSRTDFPSKYSLGSLRLAAYLESTIDVRIVSASVGEPNNAIVERLVDAGQEIIALPCYSWTTEKSRRIAQLIDKHSKTIIAGGPQITSQDYDPATWPKRTVFVMGDGEEALARLSQLKKSFSSNPSALIQFTDSTNTRIERNSLNYSPAISPENLKRITNDENPFSEDFVWWETSRGCPFSCGFCKHQQGRLIRMFKKEFLEQELKYLSTFAPKKMFIVDPNIGGTRSNGKEIFKMLQKNIPQTAIVAYMRPELLDDEYVNLLASSNIEELLIGIQTTNPNVPETIRKNNFTFIERYLPALRDRKIHWRAELIIGLPGDDVTGFRETLRFVIEQLKPSTLYAYHLTVLKGTLVDQIAQQKIPGFFLSYDSSRKAVESNTYSKAELTHMLEAGGGISSLYRFMEKNQWFGKEKKLRNLSELERILEKAILKFPNAKKIFEQEKRLKSQQTWELFFNEEKN